MSEFQDPGSGTSTTQEEKFDEQVCICMWTEVNGPIGPNELVERKGKLKFMDDLVDVLYRNMEEYAVNKETTGTGTVAEGNELPFIVHYISPGWLGKLKPIQFSKLLDYFCQVDMKQPEGERLVVEKADLFGLIADDKGRDALEKLLKSELGFNGVSAKNVTKPFEGFIKYLESTEYNSLNLESRFQKYGATVEVGEGKDGEGGEDDVDDDEEDNAEDEEDEDDE